MVDGKALSRVAELVRPHAGRRVRIAVHFTGAYQSGCGRIAARLFLVA